MQRQQERYKRRSGDVIYFFFLATANSKASRLVSLGKSDTLIQVKRYLHHTDI